MGSIPPSSPTKLRPRSRDTGFPEPFCGNRNTTLPHPEADLSPNACISSEDISVNKVLHRSRRSFLSKNKRTISHGKITSEMEQMYSDMVIESEADSPDHEKPNPLGNSLIVPRHSKDSAVSLDRTSSSINGDDELRKDLLHAPSEHKRRGVLRKLRIMK